MTQQSSKLSEDDREKLRQAITKASEPWPMRTMVVQSPIHGLEYLPFDQHVLKGKHLLSGNGYLTNEEYQQRYRDGRITQESLTRAFQRFGPRQDPQDLIQLESRQITALDVWWMHLIGGFKPLESAQFEWELSDHGSTKQFHQHLSEESRKRIIARTIEECELCREYPEKAYLANLWKSILSVLQLSQSQATSQQINPSVSLATGTVSLTTQWTMSGWVDNLAGVGLVAHINDRVIKWGTTFLDQELARSTMLQQLDGLYDFWRQLVQKDDSDPLFGIKGFSQKINDLPTDPEDTIALSLELLGIPQEHWREYLSRQLSLLPGWTRYIRWLGEHPDYHAQVKHPIDTTQYLAVRLFYEVELTQVACQQEWGIDGTVSALTVYWNDRPEDYRNLIGEGWHSVDQTKQMICRDAWRLFHLAQFLELSPTEVHDLSRPDAQTVLQWLDEFPADQHSPIWLEAYEESFRADILRKISTD